MTKKTIKCGCKVSKGSYTSNEHHHYIYNTVGVGALKNKTKNTLKCACKCLKRSYISNEDDHHMM
jgi:heterodisulfide reductase subunit B